MTINDGISNKTHRIKCVLTSHCDQTKTYANGDRYGAMAECCLAQENHINLTNIIVMQLPYNAR